MSTFDELKRVAVDLFWTQAPFLLRRGSAEVVLIVARERERRFALVTPEEASLFVEILNAPGEALRDLRRGADKASTCRAGAVWVVALLGDEPVYFPLDVETVSAGRAELGRN